MALVCRPWTFGTGGAQAHLLRIVDPMTGQPLTMDRIEDEASILFIAGARRSVLISSQCDSGAEPLACTECHMLS